MTSRVLVVDDDPKIAPMLAKGLRARGHEVEIAITGSDALLQIERGTVDVQLLDLGLPDMDGLDVLRRMREAGSSVPVIVITARSDPRDRATAFALGVSEYFTKPFKWARLWEAVDDCLARRDGV